MADFRTIAQKMLNEVADSLARTDPKRFEAFVETLSRKRTVLVAGDGYCAGVARVFAHALARLGLDVRVVGESTTLGVKLGDLLVVISESSGSSLMAQRTSSARAQGVSVVVLTQDARSVLLGEAQLGIILPRPTRTAVTVGGADGELPLAFPEAAMLYLNAVVRGLAQGISRRDWREGGVSLD